MVLQYSFMRISFKYLKIHVGFYVGLLMTKSPCQTGHQKKERRRNVGHWHCLPLAHAAGAAGD